MNLYQKYRPLTLNGIYGHETIITELKERGKDNNFPQVMYFTGYTGVGKTTLQRIIGKMILCTHKNDAGDPCNECEICRAINNEYPSRNYIEYNCSDLNIEDMRVISEKVGIKTLGGNRKKVLVLDELQELYSNHKARKNLLKTLEKVSNNTHFILGSMDDTRVDQAIKNRSVRYQLGSIPYKEIGLCLRDITQKEGIEVDKEKAEVLLAIGDNCSGSLRNAIATLERCIYGKIWDKKKAIKELGIMSNDEIKDLVSSILTGDATLVESYEVSEEILNSIRQRLVLLYKKKSGSTLNRWEISMINGIAKVDLKIIDYTLEKLFNLMFVQYVTKGLIEFTLLSIMAHNKQEKNS